MTGERQFLGPEHLILILRLKCHVSVSYPPLEPPRTIDLKALHTHFRCIWGYIEKGPNECLVTPSGSPRTLCLALGFSSRSPSPRFGLAALTERRQCNTFLYRFDREAQLLPVALAHCERCHCGRFYWLLPVDL